MLKIAFCGDVMPGGMLAYKKNFVSAEIKNELSKADFRICTLECALGEGIPFDKGKMLKGKNIVYARNVDIEKVIYLGFNAVSLANNHIFDLGKDGLTNTIKILNDNNISYFGAGNNIKEASRPLIIEKNGKKIALFGCCFKGTFPNVVEAATETTPGVFQTDIKTIRQLITDAKKKYDCVVVLPHWCEAYNMLPPVVCYKMAKQMISSGADAIIGSHPHIINPLYHYKSKPVFFSLGNFLFPDICVQVPRPMFYPQTQEDAIKLAVVENYPNSVDCPSRVIWSKNSRIGLIAILGVDNGKIHSEYKFSKLSKNNELELLHGKDLDRINKIFNSINKKINNPLYGIVNNYQNRKIELMRKIIGKLYGLVKRLIKKITVTIQIYSCRNSLLYNLYSSTILPLQVKWFLNHNGMETLLMDGKSLREDYIIGQTKFSNGNILELNKKDVIASYILYFITPTEYLLYNFHKKKHKERMSFLSDHERLYGCAKRMSWKPFLELRDKSVFYGMTRKYFKRDVCVVNEHANMQDVLAFCEKNPTFFAKPLLGTLGMGTGIYKCDNWSNFEDVYLHFKNAGGYILETVIKQDPRMSKWNISSVNTIRVPSFRRGNSIIILQPFMRTGRKGKVVDNGGAGGIFAVINEKTGIVETDGFDEYGNSYKQHPDSGVTFKDWKIPSWNELIELTKEIHLSLPKDHIYVGFDFSLTETGWILIEGNWGQLLGQIAEQKGVRSKFEMLLGLAVNSYISNL